MRASIWVLYIFILLVTYSIPGFAYDQEIDMIAKLTLTGNVSTLKNGTNNTNDKNTVKKNVTVLNVDADTSYNSIVTRYKTAVNRLKQQAYSVAAYIKKNNYSTDYIFLIDMSIPSGKNRFFVYNLKKDTLECSSLVAHGFGSTIKGTECDLIFSNNNYSCKTSLGKYKIGALYKGLYGMAYKLYGLDTSNSKAFERAIVLHSDVHIPDNETYPAKIFQSAGCPAVSPTFLPILGKYIKGSKKPILMWIYN